MNNEPNAQQPRIQLGDDVTFDAIMQEHTRLLLNKHHYQTVVAAIVAASRKTVGKIAATLNKQYLPPSGPPAP